MKRATRSRSRLQAAKRRLWGLLLGAAAGSVGAHDGREMSVVTLNLWHDAGDWPRRATLIVRTLRALRPDYGVRAVLRRRP